MVAQNILKLIFEKYTYWEYKEVSDVSHNISDNSNQNCIYFITRKDANLTDLKETRTIFEKIRPTSVIHLAAKVGGLFNNINNNYDFLIQNLYINLNVTQCCVEYNIKKLINISSTCIFPHDSPLPLQETNIHNGQPHSSNYGYAYAKRMMSVMGQALTEKDIIVITLIPTNLYGIGDNYKINEAHVIPDLIHKFYLAKKHSQPQLNLKGTGGAIRTFLYCEDFADIILSCLAQASYSRDMIITPPNIEEISIKDLVYKIKNLVGYTGNIQFDNNPIHDGQIKKSASDTIFKKYYPLYQFTSLDKGLQLTYNNFIDCINVLRLN